jgi:mxaL protein
VNPARWSPVLAALLIAASFTEPRVPLPRPRFEHVVVLDVTQSMNVTDVELDGRPASRLALARRALHEVLDVLPCGSRLGWGIFTEYRSFLLMAPVEVCAHRAELRATLAGIDGRMAWSGNSEVAKGVHAGIGIAKELPGKPALVFVTDGHESPPLNPRHRPRFDDKPGEVPGVLVGVGGLRPAPIPKFDARGRPLGTWAADEVQQVDPRSQGRGGSVSGESMTDDAAGGAAVALGATPGSEHLSALREAYLKLLASENGLAYARLTSTDALVAAMAAPALERPVTVAFDLRLVLGALAFALLLWPHLAAWRRR